MNLKLWQNHQRYFLGGLNQNNVEEVIKKSIHLLSMLRGIETNGVQDNKKLKIYYDSERSRYMKSHFGKYEVDTPEMLIPTLEELENL